MNANIIRLEKIDRIRIRILVFGLNYLNIIQIPNYSLTSASHGVHHDIIHGVPDTNIIRFENIDRIRIRILVFGPNYSNNIRIPNYSLTSGVSLKKFNKGILCEQKCG